MWQSCSRRADQIAGRGPNNREVLNALLERRLEASRAHWAELAERPPWRGRDLVEMAMIEIPAPCGLQLEDGHSLDRRRHGPWYRVGESGRLGWAKSPGVVQ